MINVESTEKWVMMIMSRKVSHHRSLLPTGTTIKIIFEKQLKLTSRAQKSSIFELDEIR